MRNKNRWSASFLLLATLLMLVGCSRQTVYSHYVSIDANGWEQHDPLGFGVSPLSAGLYDAEVELRINAAYPYTSLTLIVEQCTSLSHIVRTDTICLPMVDASGTSQGKGIGLKSYCRLLSPLTLLEGDSLHVSIRHFMRQSPLPGIADVGFTLRNR